VVGSSRPLQRWTTQRPWDWACGEPADLVCESSRGTCRAGLGWDIVRCRWGTHRRWVRTRALCYGPRSPDTAAFSHSCTSSRD